MAIYVLKIESKWYEDIKKGDRDFEIRRSNEAFEVGDELVLKEWDGEKYTGREIRKKIKYIYQGDGTNGLSEEFCILGLCAPTFLFRRAERE